MLHWVSVRWLLGSFPRSAGGRQAPSSLTYSFATSHAMLWENEICVAEVLAKFLGRCEYEGRLLDREESPPSRNELRDLHGKLLSPGTQTLHSSRRWFTWKQGLSSFNDYLKRVLEKHDLLTFGTFWCLESCVLPTFELRSFASADSIASVIVSSSVSRKDKATEFTMMSSIPGRRKQRNMLPIFVVPRSVIWLGTFTRCTLQSHDQSWGTSDSLWCLKREQSREQVSHNHGGYVLAKAQVHNDETKLRCPGQV